MINATGRIFHLKAPMNQSRNTFHCPAIAGRAKMTIAFEGLTIILSERINAIMRYDFAVLF
jgi:hypothetical protein